MNSNRPYLLRAIYEWILDNGKTPYILVDANAELNELPERFVKDNNIILNIHPASVRDLELGNEYVSFSARFGNRSCQIKVVSGSIKAIYAKENGIGMIFPEEENNGELITSSENKPQKPDLKIVE